MTSFIRDFIQFLSEATEDLRVPFDPSKSTEATPPPAAGSAMTDDNFAPAPPPQASSELGLPPVPNMPTGNVSNAEQTISKTIVNKDLVLSITAELKAMISTYEKKFENEDMTLEASQIYLSNFLGSLAFYADKVKKISGLAGEEAQASEPVLPEEPTPAATPAPTEPTEAIEPTPEEASQSTEEGGFTEPIEPLPGSQTTNPTEAIR